MTVQYKYTYYLLVTNRNFNDLFNSPSELIQKSFDTPH